MVDPERALKSAQNLAHVMTVGIILIGCGAAVLLVLALQDLNSAGEILAAQAGYGAYPVSAWQTFALMAVVTVHVLFWIVLFGVARRLFGQLASGSVASAAQTARRAATLLWIWLVWGIASQSISSVAASWSYPEGERALAIAFGSSQLSIVFAAMIASFLAHAFALGAELWQDHREVI